MYSDAFYFIFIIFSLLESSIQQGCCTSIPKVEKGEEHNASQSHTHFLLDRTYCFLHWARSQSHVWLLKPEGKGTRRHYLKEQAAPQKKKHFLHQTYFAGKGRGVCVGETLNPEAGGRQYTHTKVQALQDHLSPVTVACNEKSSTWVKH